MLISWMRKMRLRVFAQLAQNSSLDVAEPGVELILSDSQPWDLYHQVILPARA